MSAVREVKRLWADGLNVSTEISLRHAEQLDAAMAEIERLRAQVIAGVFDAASVGITLIKTEELERLRAELKAITQSRDELKHRYRLMDDIIKDDCETEAECRKLLAKWDTSDSFRTLTVSELIEAALKELATCRNAELEEAAKVCDKLAQNIYDEYGVTDQETGERMLPTRFMDTVEADEECAKQIRALKREGGGT